MPLNGFKPGKTLWVELNCKSIRADFLGRLLYVTETEGNNYHLQFHGGFTLTFNREDLEAGHIKCHEHPIPQKDPDQ